MKKIKKQKLKILELTNFSAGICGVWQRVRQESIELSRKGYEVRIFSSNAVKGSNELAPGEDKIGKIKIKRFPFKKIGGESFLSWKFEREALEFKPNIIIAHAYRHLHTTKALKVAKELKKQGNECKTILVTHAPFIENNKTRSFPAKIIVSFYDKLIAPRALKKFDKIIAITNWEIPYLLKLGCEKEKITYIPNGLPEEFFKTKREKAKKNTNLFLGRISPIKSLEVLIKAVSLLGKNINLDVVGPFEENYGNKIKNLVKDLSLEKQIKFHPAIYNVNEKISIIDKHEIFVLPSKREAMPQVLLEALARGKIVVSSATQGGKEIINPKNGFLFDIGNEKQLAELIKKIQKMNEKEKSKIRKEAINSAKKFAWKKLIKDLEKSFS